MSTISRLKRKVSDKQTELRAAIEALHSVTGTSFVPRSPELPLPYVSSCRVLNSRFSILNLMPKAAVCAEVGVRSGHFTRAILTATHPAALHLFDINFSDFDHTAFAGESVQAVITLHKGDPATLLSELPDHSFDWVYLAGDHSYSGVSKNLNMAMRKTKANGFIICNDYSVWSQDDVVQSSVQLCVNEFCLRENWELTYLGLHGQGCHDICLRRRC